MLISYQHRFLFVHIYKNAGRSIATALLPHAANPLVRFMDKGCRKLGLVCPRSPQPLADHVTAQELMDYFGEELYRSLYSFAIVRNPWAWQVSLYEFMRMRADHHQHELASQFTDFDEYIKWRCADDAHTQKDFIYSGSGEKLVSFVGRFENLEQDFQHICRQIGVEASLPRLNVSASRPYQEYYNDSSVDLVRRTFREDIELFEYEFDA